LTNRIENQLPHRGQYSVAADNVLVDFDIDNHSRTHG
jgi:hypothetical protein